MRNTILILVILFFSITCKDNAVSVEKINATQYQAIIKKNQQEMLIHFWSSYCLPCI